MEKMKMDTLYELLETGNFNENTDGALIWAIFELESSYSTIVIPVSANFCAVSAEGV